MQDESFLHGILPFSIANRPNCKLSGRSHSVFSPNLFQNKIRSVERPGLAGRPEKARLSTDLSHGVAVSLYCYFL